MECIDRSDKTATVASNASNFSSILSIHRGLAISLGMTVARVVCFSGVTLVGSLIIDHCQVTFYCWGAFLFSKYGVCNFCTYKTFNN